MTSKSRNRVIALVGILACLLLLFFLSPLFKWTRVIEEGEFHRMRIGQSPEDVVQALREWGVEAVAPTVDYRVRITLGNVDRINDLSSAAAIQLANSRGISIQLFFTDDTLTRLDVSAGAHGETFGIAIGQSKGTVLSNVSAAMKRVPGLRAINIVPDFQWINLAAVSGADIELLKRYNSWTYGEPNSYSFALLRFSNGRLVAIEYTWVPFEGL